MIDKQFISSAVADAISGTDIFIVDVEIDADDNIVVLLDSPGLLDLDEVSEISRKVNASIEAADPAYNYSLELGSAGLTSPLKVRGQYEKNVGNANARKKCVSRERSALLSRLWPRTSMFRPECAVSYL